MIFKNSYECTTCELISSRSASVSDPLATESAPSSPGVSNGNDESSESEMVRLPRCDRVSSAFRGGHQERIVAQSLPMPPVWSAARGLSR